MSDAKTVSTRSSRGTRALAGRIAKAAAARFERGEGGVVIGLSGELGAGKTTFAQGFVAALDGGAGLVVTSPTFAIAQSYPTRPPVKHIDLYRLGSLAELEAIGYRDLYAADALVLVEWIDRVPEAIPSEWLEIHLAGSGSGVRELRLRAFGSGLFGLVSAATSNTRRRA